MYLVVKLDIYLLRKILLQHHQASRPQGWQIASRAERNRHETEGKERPLPVVLPQFRTYGTVRDIKIF